jgi:hypothetical protein
VTREEINTYKRQWKRINRLNNGEQVRAADRRWYASLPRRKRQELARIKNAKTRKLKTNWQRNNFRLYQYGLTQEAFEAMIKRQRGRCAICRVVPPHVLYVDHDHVTGKVRGLLCQVCNYAMAAVDRCPDWPERAKKYRPR